METLEMQDVTAFFFSLWLYNLYFQRMPHTKSAARKKKKKKTVYWMPSQTDLNLEEMCHCFKLALTPHWLSLGLLMNYHWSWCDPDWGIYYISIHQDGCSAVLCKLSYSRKHFPLTIEMDLLVWLNYHEHFF